MYAHSGGVNIWQNFNQSVNRFSIFSYRPISLLDNMGKVLFAWLEGLCSVRSLANYSLTLMNLHIILHIIRCRQAIDRGRYTAYFNTTAVDVEPA